VGTFSRPPQIEAVAPSPGVSNHPSVGPIANQSGSHRVVVDSESPSSSSQTLRLELEEEADRLSKVDFYELLGVAPDMPASAIQTAFLKSAKRWHPDRLDGGLSDLKPLASKVFSRMTEAHQVLTNASRRSEYDAALEDAGADSSEREQVQKVLRAANNFQKAQVLVKRSEWEEATKFAQLAQDDDPDQAEYVALAAWLAHRKLQGSAPEAYAPLLEKLARAEKKQPNNLRVRMYRADVLKAAGKVNEAVREYRFIAEADPNNVEAQRELRLYKMRANSPTSDAPGLFGRFFKKGQ
jgi:curved DNA-binding protein CbpA